MRFFEPVTVLVKLIKLVGYMNTFYKKARRGGQGLEPENCLLLALQTKVRRNTVTDGESVTVTGNGADSLLPSPGGATLCVPGQRKPEGVLLPFPGTELCYRSPKKTTPSLDSNLPDL